MYVAKTYSEVTSLVTEQPVPLVFFKTFLELDCSNMVSMLAQNNKALQYLLDDKFEEFFNAKYPLFYKNKVPKSDFERQKFFYRSPIDSAIKHD